MWTRVSLAALVISVVLSSQVTEAPQVYFDINGLHCTGVDKEIVKSPNYVSDMYNNSDSYYLHESNSQAASGLDKIKVLNLQFKGNRQTFHCQSVVIPEPATIAMLGFGTGLAIMFHRKR
jgi:hypothetical protein